MASPCATMYVAFFAFQQVYARIRAVQRGLTDVGAPRELVGRPCGCKFSQSVKRWLRPQVVGQLQQRHHVLHVGPHVAFSPTPNGVAIGSQAAIPDHDRPDSSLAVL